MHRKSTIARYNESLIKEEKKEELKSVKGESIYFINDNSSFSLIEGYILDDTPINGTIKVWGKSQDINYPFEGEFKIDYNKLKFKKK